MTTLSETGPKNIYLIVGELADLYTLKTLYDYLTQYVIEGKLDAKLSFFGDINTTRSREVLQNVPIMEKFERSSIDTLVSCYSDNSSGGDLEIDISILKNCVVPMDREEIDELKHKYGVDSQEPIVVIGYAEPSLDV